ncbi:uncharacterized [Tachysurus ichikawai]
MPVFVARKLSDVVSTFSHLCLFCSTVPVCPPRVFRSAVLNQWGAPAIFQRLLLVFLETFVVFGDSKARITLQLGLLCSTSSRCCHEPLSRPKALTGGQSLSSLALQSEQRGDSGQH